MTELLRMEGVSAGYGDALVLDGIDLTLLRRRQPGAAGPQRRGQDHAAGHA